MKFEPLPEGELGMAWEMNLRFQIKSNDDPPTFDQLWEFIRVVGHWGDTSHLRQDVMLKHYDLLKSIKKHSDRF